MSWVFKLLTITKEDGKDRTWPCVGFVKPSTDCDVEEDNFKEILVANDIFCAMRLCHYLNGGNLGESLNEFTHVTNGIRFLLNEYTFENLLESARKEWGVESEGE